MLEFANATGMDDRVDLPAAQDAAGQEAQHRAKWGLKPDYPMVAPAYAAKRQELAKKIGLGRKPRMPQPAPAPVKTRGRKKAAA